jgi:hypothetical protein
MAQDDPKQMRALAPTVNPNPRPLTRIHLCFLSWFHLHPHERHRLGLEQLPHEALHRMITTGEPMVTNQILINPLG